MHTKVAPSVHSKAIGVKIKIPINKEWMLKISSNQDIRIESLKHTTSRCKGTYFFNKNINATTIQSEWQKIIDVVDLHSPQIEEKKGTWGTKLKLEGQVRNFFGSSDFCKTRPFHLLPDLVLPGQQLRFSSLRILCKCLSPRTKIPKHKPQTMDSLMLSSAV